MLPLVIVRPVEAESFANGCESISGGRWHGIVIEGHRVVRRLIVLSSFPSLLGDFLFRVTVFA
jgi:hypothetical protein